MMDAVFSLIEQNLPGVFSLCVQIGTVSVETDLTVGTESDVSCSAAVMCSERESRCRMWDEERFKLVISIIYLELVLPALHS